VFVRSRADIGALAILAGLVVAFFWDVLVGPRVLLPVDVLYTIAPWSVLAPASFHGVPHNALIGDAILQNVAWKSIARDAFQRGELPLYSPFEYAGLPFLAGGQSGALYPPGVLFYVLPVQCAYGPFLALHVFIAGAGAYASARLLGARPAAAIVGAIAFGFAGFTVVSFTWPMIVSALAWLPVLLAGTEAICQRVELGRSRAGTLVLSAVVALAIGAHVLAGHLEVTLYTGFALVVFGSVRIVVAIARAGPRRALGLLATLAGTATVGLGLAAIQIVPFAELMGQNVRGGAIDLATARSYALPVTQVATFLMPDFYGNPTTHAYFSVADRTMRTVGQNALGTATDPPSTVWWGSPKNYVEATAYVGILPLLLALALGWRRSGAAALALVGIAIWSLLMMFGSPTYALLFTFVPGGDQLHTPFRWILPYSLAVAVLAALGAERLARAPDPRTARFGTGLLLLGGLGVVIAASTLLVPEPAIAAAADLVRRSSRLARAFADGDALLSHLWRVGGLFSLTLLASGFALRRLARGARHALWLIAGILAIDLFIAFAGFNTRAAPAPLPEMRELTKNLRADDPARIVSFGTDEPMTPLTSALVSLEDVRGYDTVIPRRYVEFWNLVEPARGLEYSKLQGLVRVESLASPLLHFLNVHYVVSTRPISSPHLAPVEVPGLYAYRLLGALPRAHLISAARVVASANQVLPELARSDFDPSREAVVTAASLARFRPLDANLRTQLENTSGGVPVNLATGTPASIEDRVQYLERHPHSATLDVNSAAGGVLVMAEYDAPGWRARVGGMEVPVVTVNHAFRAIPVPPGTHRVETWYAPTSLRSGAIISAASLLIVLVALFGAAWTVLSGRASGVGTTHVVARNAITGIGTTLVNRGLDFGFAILTLRVLQPEGVGQYAIAIAIAGYLEIASNFGLNALLIRDGARPDAPLSRLGGSSLLVRLVVWVTGVPAVAGLLALWQSTIGLGGDTVTAALLLCAALLPGHVGSTYSAMLIARDRMDITSAMTTVTTVFKIGLGAWALLVGWGIVGLAAVAIAANVVTAVALALLAGWTGVGAHLRVDRKMARAMIGPAAPLLLNHLLATLFFRVDLLLLQPMRGEREVGYYAAAYKFVDAFGIISSTVTFALFPLISRLAQEASEEARRTYLTALRTLLFLSIPCVLLVTACAYPAVHLLGGAEFVPMASDTLRVLIWFLPMSYANGLTQYVLVATGQVRLIAIGFIVGLVLNVVMNLIVIPPFGVLGAAATTVVSEFALAIPFALALSSSLRVHYFAALAPYLGLAAIGGSAFYAFEQIAGGAVALLLSMLACTAISLATPRLRMDLVMTLRVLRRRPTAGIVIPAPSGVDP